MSGGPPHHSHNRPPANTAWNHLQVPNFFPTRQPQHAHMSNEHPLLHQPTWHTPTTEPLKAPMQHSHLFNLEQMLSDRPFATRHTPGVDLSITRNGNQNGDLPTAPISLSVRDTNKINSLAASALDIQGTELKSLNKPPSPGIKAVSPTPLVQAAIKAKRVDSILERLNPPHTSDENKTLDLTEKPTQSSVIVQATSSHDENSNSSSLNVPTTQREEEVVSPYSNEDSLDSNKSRRKRKPCKTMRVAKEHPSSDTQHEVSNEKKVPERRKSQSPPNGESPQRKSRRKTSSESETIDKIAAMVNETSSPNNDVINVPKNVDVAKDVTSAVVVTAAQKKDFVAVEDKLEEMFAGLEDPKTPLAHDKGVCSDAIEVLTSIPSTSQEKVTSTSNDVGNGSVNSSGKKKRMQKKRQISGKQNDKKKKNAKKEGGSKKAALNNKKINGKAKLDAVKDVYAYDSGSNASSSKSKGPFVQIRGPRDSPFAVSVINTPINDDDCDKKPNKTKKFHDDSEYRLKVRSKGLHCSTLSNKYDAQTKDASWICVFCKRGPYSSEFTMENAFYTPGDLFGPYVITHNCPEFERRIDDPYDKQFCSKKVCRTVDGLYKHKKSKRKNSECDDGGGGDVNAGITNMDEGNYEVWAHEDCIVWSPGIYLVGPKIIGLEEAIWTCSNVSCVKCNIKGANICCLKRGCASVVHLGCAYISNWELDEASYKAFCVEHRKII